MKVLHLLNTSSYSGVENVAITMESFTKIGFAKLKLTNQILNCCKLSLNLGVSANKSLIALKNMIKSSMMKPIWRLP